MKKQAFVTGADRGLGHALVKLLLEKNYHVYAGSFLPDWKLLRELKNQYVNNLDILPLDVTSDDSVQNAANSIASSTNNLNLLINNAGIAQDRSGTILEHQNYEDIRALYETNAIGTLRVTHSVIKLLMNADNKTLVNISSIAGSVGSVTRIQQYGYTMSKAAINMQTKMIHNHFKDQGLKVFSIHPGWMRSYLFGDIERMKNAPLEPIDSAKCIIRLVESKNEIDEDIYMDYEGNPLPW